ncbi:hypothetical protein HK097_009139 [Rhizophlyctis rosea]|uniref:Ribonuclease H n=1 Tax=Rhizophlyctis rosea TaxID=64517 RepID=A0AAD5SAZ0_9FUNG|nr:hypothetical protein HK097_009139 [Rhizophlyctis rosea]
MKRKAAGKFYAVRMGRVPGIYSTWDECKAQTDHFPGAIFKSFPGKDAALAFLSSSGPTPKARPSPKKQTTRSPSPNRKKQKLSPSPPESTSSSRKRSRSPPSDDDAYGDDLAIAYIEAEAKSNTPSSTSAQTTVIHKPAPTISTSTLPKLDVYTDGSCIGNGQMGARAGIGVWYGPNDDRNIFERLPGNNQTNNRAEVLAAIRAIESAPPNRFLTIHSDSKYMRDGITKWLPGWKRKNWKTATGKDVLNQDLWRKLDEVQDSYQGVIVFQYVRAHVGIPGNEGADYLANRGAELEFVDA